MLNTNLKNYIGLWAAAYHYPQVKLTDGTLIPAGQQHWARFLHDANPRQLARAHTYMSDFEFRLQCYYLQIQITDRSLVLPTLLERAQSHVQALQLSRSAIHTLHLTEALEGLEEVTQPLLAIAS